MRRTRPMMGESNPQPRFYYNISLESFVPADHPLRRIRPLIDHAAIRRECRPLYSDRGRPSIPPEQLFLALIGGYLLGVTSERRLVMELQCNMALRWFVGLNIDEDSWDASTFSQNRRRRFDKAGILAAVRPDAEACVRRGLGEPSRERRRHAGPRQCELQELRTDRGDPEPGGVQGAAAAAGQG